MRDRTMREHGVDKNFPPLIEGARYTPSSFFSINATTRRFPIRGHVGLSFDPIFRLTEFFPRLIIERIRFRFRYPKFHVRRPHENVRKRCSSTLKFRAKNSERGRVKYGIPVFPEIFSDFPPDFRPAIQVVNWGN